MTVHLVIPLPEIPYIYTMYIWFWPTLGVGKIDARCSPKRQHAQRTCALCGCVGGCGCECARMCVRARVCVCVCVRVPYVCALPPPLGPLMPQHDASG